MPYRPLRVVVTDWGNRRGRIFSPTGLPLVRVYLNQSRSVRMNTVRVWSIPSSGPARVNLMPTHG